MKKISENIFDKKMTIITIICIAFLLTPTINAKLLPSTVSASTSRASVDEVAIVGDSIYDLLIIAPSCFVDELRPLVCHKYQVGVSTRLVTLCEVYDQMYWHGRDGAEKNKILHKDSNG